MFVASMSQKKKGACPLPFQNTNIYYDKIDKILYRTNIQIKMGYRFQLITHFQTKCEKYALQI